MSLFKYVLFFSIFSLYLLDDIKISEIKKQLNQYIENIKKNDPEFYEKERAFFDDLQKQIDSLSEDNDDDKNIEILKNINKRLNDKLKEYMSEKDLANIKVLQEFISRISNFIKKLVEEEEDDDDDKKKKYSYIANITILNSIFILIFVFVIAVMIYIIWAMRRSNGKKFSCCPCKKKDNLDESDKQRLSKEIEMSNNNVKGFNFLDENLDSDL